MKTNTQKRIKQVLLYLKRKDAHFWVDKEDGQTYYTYPKGGWVDGATINGVPVEYVAEHDTGENELPCKLTGTRNISCPVLGKIGQL